MKFTQIPTTAMEEMQLNAGVLLSSFTPSTAEVSGIIGATIPCDGGFIWLKRGSPWCQNLQDDTDQNIKRRYINVTAEYMTLN